jgi:hypothetical protein
MPASGLAGAGATLGGAAGALGGSLDAACARLRPGLARAARFGRLPDTLIGGRLLRLAVVGGAPCAAAALMSMTAMLAAAETEASK